MGNFTNNKKKESKKKEIGRILELRQFEVKKLVVRYLEIPFLSLYIYLYIKIDILLLNGFN